MSQANETSLREKQIILLQRNWKLIDDLKVYRVQFPSLICTLNLAITSFTLNSQNISVNIFQKCGIVFVLVVISIFGVLVLRNIQQQYKYFFERINYLSNQLGMYEKGFIEPSKYKVSQDSSLYGQGIFLASYAAIFLIGITCVMGILGLDT